MPICFSIFFDVYFGGYGSEFVAQKGLDGLMCTNGKNSILTHNSESSDHFGMSKIWMRSQHIGSFNRESEVFNRKLGKFSCCPPGFFTRPLDAVRTRHACWSMRIAWAWGRRYFTAPGRKKMYPQTTYNMDIEWYGEWYRKCIMCKSFSRGNQGCFPHLSLSLWVPFGNHMCLENPPPARCLTGKSTNSMGEFQANHVWWPEGTVGSTVVLHLSLKCNPEKDRKSNHRYLRVGFFCSMYSWAHYLYTYNAINR